MVAKHVDDLKLHNIKITCKVPDDRHVCVFDDINGVEIDGLEADCRKGRKPIAVINHHFRRHTNAENVPGQSYFTTKVEGLTIKKGIQVRPDTGGLCSDGLVEQIEINAPAPGTPRDSLYPYPTVPCSDTGYHFAVATDDYPLPLTVYRPFICPVAPITVKAAEHCLFQPVVRTPATDIPVPAEKEGILNEQEEKHYYSVKGIHESLSLSCENLPQGACFDVESGEFTWTPSLEQSGFHRIVFQVDDGLIPEKTTVRINVL